MYKSLQIQLGRLFGLSMKKVMNSSLDKCLKLQEQQKVISKLIIRIYG